jgi:uncharacterized iron-regulated membrane protein
MAETETPVVPQEAPRKASRTRVLLMLTLGGLVLAVGGCALFLAFLNVNGGSSERDTLSAAGALLFIAGVLAFIVGVLWAFARWADRRFAKTAKK